MTAPGAANVKARPASGFPSAVTVTVTGVPCPVALGIIAGALTVTA
jgi:hypothetical protein